MNLCVQSGGLTGHFSTEENYRLIAEAGFSSVDLNIDNAFNRVLMRDHIGEGLCIFEKPLPEVMAYFKRDLDAIKNAGLYVYQAHAPFPAYYKDRPAFTDGCIEIYKKCILFCQEIGCRRLIIHGVSLTRDDTQHTQKDIDAVNDHLYTSLIDTLKGTDVVVCLENLFSGYEGTIYQGTCQVAAEACAMIDRYNDLAGKECFGLCCDTGHLNLVGNSQYDYIKAIGKRMKAFHIHDNDGKSDLHLAPYTGSVDWEGFCRAVKEIGYDGDLSFETFRQYAKGRMPEDRAVFPYLKLVAEIGKVFKQKISE